MFVWKRMNYMLKILTILGSIVWRIGGGPIWPFNEHWELHFDYELIYSYELRKWQGQWLWEQFGFAIISHKLLVFYPTRSGGREKSVWLTPVYFTVKTNIVCHTNTTNFSTTQKALPLLQSIPLCCSPWDHHYCHAWSLLADQNKALQHQTSNRIHQTSTLVLGK